MKKKLAAAALVLLLAAGVAFYRVVIVLPPADPSSRALQGEKAPAFVLAATTAPRLGLADLTRDGRAAVLVFNRGHW